MFRDDSIEVELELLSDELLRLKVERIIDEDEIDVIKALIASIAMKKLNIDKETILSYLFKNGRPITWN